MITLHSMVSFHNMFIIMSDCKIVSSKQKPIQNHTTFICSLFLHHELHHYYTTDQWDNEMGFDICEMFIITSMCLASALSWSAFEMHTILYIPGLSDDCTDQFMWTTQVYGWLYLCLDCATLFYELIKTTSVTTDNWATLAHHCSHAAAWQTKEHATILQCGFCFYCVMYDYTFILFISASCELDHK